MLRTHALIATAVALVACTTTAPTPRNVPDRMPAYISPISNTVLPVRGQPGTFEVLADAGNSAKHFRCSAGSYVIEALGLLPNRRIYLVEPLGRSAQHANRRSITFTVLPDESLRQVAEALPKDNMLEMTQPGDSFTAGSGRHLCETIIPFYWDLP